MEEGEEGDGITGEDLAVGISDGARDAHALDDGVDGGHGRRWVFLCSCVSSWGIWGISKAGSKRKNDGMIEDWVRQE